MAVFANKSALVFISQSVNIKIFGEKKPRCLTLGFSPVSWVHLKMDVVKKIEYGSLFLKMVFNTLTGYLLEIQVNRSITDVS